MTTWLDRSSQAAAIRVLSSSEETRREDETDLSVDDDDRGDPFAAFTEWASPEEDEAWKDL